MENRSTIIAVIGVIVAVVLVLVVLNFYGNSTVVNNMATTTPVATSTDDNADLAKIKSFEDCVKAGYPVAESSPRQCLMPDGRTYAEEIEQEPTHSGEATRDMIFVTNPYAGAVVGKTFKVTGSARGNWYFEASFPVEVRDKNGKKIAEKPAQAKGEWMTTNFVPFEVDIKVPDSYIGPATIILHKDNPSGDPSKDASLSIPITIEY